MAVENKVAAWVLSMLAVAFLAWAGAIYDMGLRILHRLDDLNAQFHSYELQANDRIRSNEKDIENVLDLLRREHGK